MNYWPGLIIDFYGFTELKVETPTGRKTYIHALQKADNGSYRDLEKIIKSAIEESLKEVEKTLIKS